jgi:hypothetical protein
VEAEYGNSERARQGVVAALSLSSGRDLQVYAAFVLALAGDTARARTMADDVAKRAPTSTLIRGFWLPATRAAIELHRNNPGKALEFLQGTSTNQSTGVGLYGLYLRGKAKVLLHQGKDAAADFEEILDHKGIVRNDYHGALARLGLGRAYALSGDVAKARTAYQDFLTLWKDADPDVPILKEAKAEYAKLQ